MRITSWVGQGVAALALTLSLTSLAQAQVTPIASPFVGTALEDFESFPNWRTGPAPMVSPTSIFGGLAQLTGSDNEVYEPGVANWVLDPGRRAGVADGAKGLAVNGDMTKPLDSTITFVTPVTQFGGFFANARTFVPASFNGLAIHFFDTNGVEFFSESWDDPTPAGELTWHGWASSTPIQKITFDRLIPAMDSLRITGGGAAAPEPGTLALVGLGLAGVAARRRRRA